MKTCLVTVLTLGLAGTGLAAPTRAVSAHLSQRHVTALQDLVQRQTDVSLSPSERDALLADLIDDLDPGYGIYRRRPDANLVSAADAGDSKAKKSASDYYGPVAPFNDATDAIDRLNRGNRGALGSVTYTVGDLYDRSDKKERDGPLDGDMVTGLLKRANAAEQGELLGGLLDALPLPGLARRESAAEQGELLGGLLQGLPLSGLVKRETVAKQGELLGGLLDALPLPGPVKRDSAAEQGELLGGLLQGLPLSGLVKREMAAEQERVAKQETVARQLRNMIIEGLAALQQATNRAHDKRDSETPGLNGLAGVVDGRLSDSASLVLEKVMGLLALDKDGLPVDAKIALDAAPVVTDVKPLAANLAISAGSQKKSVGGVRNGLAQGGESDKLVEGKLAKEGAGLAAGKLSQAKNSTFVVGQPKPQQAN